MRALSAAEAISPAINRTREFLFAPPFRWATFLKLCLVAVITEGLGTNLQSNANKHHASSGGPGPIAYNFSPTIIAACVAMALLLFVVVLLIFYVMTRLRFSYFHCLVTNTRLIKPGWNLYRPQANRFFRMNVWVGLCFALMAGLMVAPFVPGFIRLFRGIQAGNGPDVQLILSLALPLIPIFMILVVAGIALDIILRDWMLPHYALEDARLVKPGRRCGNESSKRRDRSSLMRFSGLCSRLSPSSVSSLCCSFRDWCLWGVSPERNMQFTPPSPMQPALLRRSEPCWRFLSVWSHWDLGW